MTEFPGGAPVDNEWVEDASTPTIKRSYFLKKVFGEEPPEGYANYIRALTLSSAEREYYQKRLLGQLIDKLSVSGTVPTYSNLSLNEVDEGEIWLVKDTGKLFLRLNSEFVDVGPLGSKGDKGDKGDGVELLPIVSSASKLNSEYPSGLSLTYNSADSLDFPFPYSLIVTFKRLTGRTLQLLANNTGSSLSFRVANGDIWSSFKSFIFKEDLRVDTPQMYGAKGDGEADDTAAIYKWINEGGVLKFLPPGSYRVKTVASFREGLIFIGGGGVIKGSIAGSEVLTLKGANNSLQGIIVDGSGICSVGVKLQGANSLAENCKIFNFKSTTGLAAGIWVDKYPFKVLRNEITNIVSIGNGATGDSNGASRGIYVTIPAVTGEVFSYITGNIVNRIEGEEGDAIHISVPGYASSFVEIEGNKITHFSRRGVKLQAGDVVVKNNSLKSSAIKSLYQHPINGIDSQYSDRNIIENNDVDLEGFSTAIQCVGNNTGTAKNKETEVRGNRCKGGSIQFRGIIKGSIANNEVRDTESSWAIYVSDTELSTITGNDINLFNSPVTDTSAYVYLNANTENNLVSGNTLAGERRTYEIFNGNSSNKVENNSVLNR